MVAYHHWEPTATECNDRLSGLAGVAFFPLTETVVAWLPRAYVGIRSLNVIALDALTVYLRVEPNG
jgi:hypothetical protein